MRVRMQQHTHPSQFLSLREIQHRVNHGLARRVLSSAQVLLVRFRWSGFPPPSAQTFNWLGYFPESVELSFFRGETLGESEHFTPSRDLNLADVGA
jgi:hypothetical protein